MKWIRVAKRPLLHTGRRRRILAHRDILHRHAFKMMDVSRHTSVDTLRGYVRDAELFKDHAGAGLL
jgi:hypothetical protein